MKEMFKNRRHLLPGDVLEVIQLTGMGLNTYYSLRHPAGGLVTCVVILCNSLAFYI